MVLPPVVSEYPLNGSTAYLRPITPKHIEVKHTFSKHFIYGFAPLQGLLHINAVSVSSTLHLHIPCSTIAEEEEVEYGVPLASLPSPRHHTPIVRPLFPRTQKPEREPFRLRPDSPSQITKRHSSAAVYAVRIFHATEPPNNDPIQTPRSLRVPGRGVGRSSCYLWSRRTTRACQRAASFLPILASFSFSSRVMFASDRLSLRCTYRFL